MPLSPRLLRPRASGATHPEARDWAARVTANGGSASSSTLAAVSKFCADIQSAGLRDRFYRLNLFCGSNLNACLVPLYRNTSAAGATLGNATDTNVNFVSDDYVETGANGGLTHAGSGKQLQTGVTPANAPQFLTGHLSCSVINNSFTNTGFALDYGSNSSVRASHFVNSENSGGQIVRLFVSDLNDTNTPAALAGGVYGRWVISRTSASQGDFYRNATNVATRTSTPTLSSSTTQLVVLGARVGLHYYSLGDGMTAAQVSVFDSAITAFLAALGRT
jgi:hypothetical protein